jgi:hypothetical protein
MENDRAVRASTAEPVAAEAQSREEAPVTEARPARDVSSSAPRRFTLGRNVDRAAQPPLERKPHDPIYRPLRIYAVDPAVSRLEGSVVMVNVPYEKLEPGPIGRLFEVDNVDGPSGARYRRADLDDTAILLRDGWDPSPSDPRFHQQMVYAVCSNVYSTFRAALGRQLSWGFRRNGERQRLLVRPHAFVGANAYYDADRGELCFGYFKASEGLAADRSLPGGYVFSCLSHDVIAHELTHAILDGLRANYTVPSGPDVVAFHEAFADLVAVFQRFSYIELVKIALGRSRGAIDKARLLTELAGQLGRTGTERRTALRSALDQSAPKLYDSGLEAHELGGLLVSAVFDAFVTVYQRKTARYLRIATGGSGVLPPGDLPSDLLDVLASRAKRLASQFLSILIRAVDYCPPADLRFGEYLRAIITADLDLVPDDVWGYREAIIDGFLRRNIYPRGVSSLSEDALLWRPTVRPCEPIGELDFAHLQFRGDPATAAGPEELRRQANILGEFVTRAEHMREFGLVTPDDPELGGDSVDKPVIESVRSARRVGPDGQLVFDLVAEITQRRLVAGSGKHPSFEIHGGSTVILGPSGEIRYAISKRVTGEGRVERRRDFIESERGQRFWIERNGRFVPRAHLFRMLHG